MADKLARYKRARIPLKYHDINIRGIPKHCAHRDHIKEFGLHLRENVEKGKSLFLWGPSSTGKSAIAGMCLVELCHIPTVMTGLYVTARRLPEYIIENTMFDDTQTYKERMQTVDLLVIDEYQIFGGENTFRQDTVEHIFRDRAELGKSTIITTNMTLMDMNDQAYTFFQVVQEHCEIIKITGHNFREKH